MKTRIIDLSLLTLTPDIFRYILSQFSGNTAIIFYQGGIIPITEFNFDADIFLLQFINTKYSLHTTIEKIISFFNNSKVNIYYEISENLTQIHLHNTYIDGQVFIFSSTKKSNLEKIISQSITLNLYIKEFTQQLEVINYNNPQNDTASEHNIFFYYSNIKYLKVIHLEENSNLNIKFTGCNLKRVDFYFNYYKKYNIIKINHSIIDNLNIFLKNKSQCPPTIKILNTIVNNIKCNLSSVQINFNAYVHCLHTVSHLNSHELEYLFGNLFEKKSNTFEETPSIIYQINIIDDNLVSIIQSSKCNNLILDWLKLKIQEDKEQHLAGFLFKKAPLLLLKNKKLFSVLNQTQQYILNELI